jgi:hypothetical protein
VLLLLHLLLLLAARSRPGRRRIQAHPAPQPRHSALVRCAKPSRGHVVSEHADMVRRQLALDIGGLEQPLKDARGQLRQLQRRRGINASWGSGACCYC